MAERYRRRPAQPPGTLKIDFQVNIPSPKTFAQAAMNTQHAIRQKVARNVANAILSESQQNLVRGKHVDEGTLLKSGFVIMDGDDAIVGYSAPHGPYIEYGTRPHMPPVQPIFEWCLRNVAVIGKTDKGKKVYAIKPEHGRPIGRAGYSKKQQSILSVTEKQLKAMAKRNAMQIPGAKIAVAMAKALRAKPGGRRRQGRQRENDEVKKCWRIAWAIALKIKERGGTPYPFFRPALGKVRANVEGIVAGSYNQVMKDLGTKTFNQFLQMGKSSMRGAIRRV
jgi:hypothetical protein